MIADISYLIGQVEALTTMLARTNEHLLSLQFEVAMLKRASLLKRKERTKRMAVRPIKDKD